MISPDGPSYTTHVALSSDRQVQERINRAVESEEMNIEVLRCLFCEGNELGMNNYEGMLQIQQVIQRKVK